MTEWFEDESFWKDLYPFIFPEKRFDVAKSEIDKVVKLARFTGGAVLDLACGPGRHAVALAQRGYQVTGVDRSAFHLEKAKSRASAANESIEWVQEDMRRFVRADTYDLALSMYTSFGFFTKKEDDLRVLRNLHESLKPGGVCVLEMTSKEWLAKHFEPTTAQEADDGTLLIERHTVIDDWSRVRNECTLIKDARAKSFQFDIMLYSGQELKDRLSEANFHPIQLFGNLDGREYGEQADRLVAAAWKP